ncbi:MAG TPA: FtsX-like permease family protein [Bryobacteraceae bacterium]|jgi:putative ABC transport system permease protein|nr:FtsX-like permease family protein [Bryobacteraceae bacterium]
MTLALLFTRLILRPMRREPVRTALTVLAVALGVGVVVAIDMAGQAAAGSFHSSLDTLAGRGGLVITAIGGINQEMLGPLVRLPYPFRFSARIADFATINGHGEALPFIGLDLIGEATQEDLEQTKSPRDAAVQLATGDPIYVGSHLGFHMGQHVRLLIGDQMHDFTVAGILARREDEIGRDNVIVADIGLAQQVTGKIGKLDSIGATLPPYGSRKHWQSVLRSALPPSYTIAPEGSQTDANRKMLSAFRWNLHVLSYIALIVGAFLIYNTIAISVVRRRNEIGILRALGATRRLVRNGFLAEALFFGIAGSVAGLALGRVMAIGAVRLIGNTVQSLYVTSEAAPVQYTVGGVLTALMIGIGVSVLAALAPAIEASQVAPAEAMARGREEYVIRLGSRRGLWWAIAALAVAAVCSQMPAVDRQPIFAYVAAALLVAGTSAAIPNIILFLDSATHRIVEKSLAVEALVALRSLRASLGRTSVMAGALAIAVAMTASVGVMVGSFRQTVWVWMNAQLQADFYLRPAGSGAADRHPTIDPDIPNRIAKLPEVAAVDRFRVYAIDYQGLPASLGGGQTDAAEMSSRTQFLPGEDGQAILKKLPTGDYAVVSEPFANKHYVHVGDSIHLGLAGKMRSFRVLGIYYDYSTERGYVILDRRTLLKYLPDPAASNAGVYLKPGANAEAARQAIDGIIGGRGVMVFSNSKLRAEAIKIFDRSFRITYALEAVAVFVAVIGIAGSLLALIIDRRREFALLRFLGAAREQVRSIILWEAGLLGLLAIGIGLVLGLLLSLLLIFVINKQSFGWTIQFHLPVVLLALALGGVYVATVLAGIYPARTAVRMEPIEAIHEE